jgi:hypothetical protein
MNRILPLLLALILASSCNFEKPLHFEEKVVSQADLKACETENCPTILVHYLKAIENDAKSKKINSIIQKSLIEKIAVNEDDISGLLSIDDAINYFIDDFRSFIEEFGNIFVSYDVDTQMQLLYQSEDYVSLELNYYLFTGGAHGYSGTNFLNFNAQTGELLDINDLFKDSEGILNYCESIFRKTFDIAEGRSINSSGFWFEGDQFHLPENIGFTDTEMILHFNQYEIASYAEGPIILTIPLTEVEQFL